MKLYEGFALAALAAVAFAACSAEGEEEDTIKVLICTSLRQHWYVEGPKVSLWLDVKPSDTVGHLKDLVKEKTNVPQRMQMFVYNGHFLDDNSKRLSDYHLRNRSEIYLSYGRGSFVSGRLYVRSKRPVLDTVTFKPEDSVRDLERAVAAKLGLQTDQLLLLCDKKILQDRRGKLRDQGVDDDKTIQISLRKGVDGKFPIYARTPWSLGPVLQVDTYVVVDPSDTVAQLKEKIIAASPSLNFEGKKFSLHRLDADETKTLAEYNVKVGDEIEVLFPC